MTLKNWKESGNYFNYKGHQIFYQKAGQGPALLLVHGFPTASWDWNKIWENLTSKFTVYTLDMIGFGYSDKPKSYGYSLTDQADLMEVFLEKKEIKSIHILAHDFGDTVVQEMIARFSMRQKQRVEGVDIQSVCLLNGGILEGGYKPRPIQKILASTIGPYLYFFLGKGTLRRNFDAIFGNKKATEKEIEEFWELLSYNDGRKVIPYIIRYLKERKKKKTRWETALRDCPIPLLLINGVDDPISGQNIVNAFRKQVPNGKVKELKGVGHYPQTEAPMEILEAYFDWLTLSIPKREKQH